MKKGTPRHFWEDKSRLTGVPEKSLSKKEKAVTPLELTHICPFPRSMVSSMSLAPKIWSSAAILLCYCFGCNCCYCCCVLCVYVVYVMYIYIYTHIYIHTYVYIYIYIYICVLLVWFTYLVELCLFLVLGRDLADAGVVVPQKGTDKGIGRQGTVPKRGISFQRQPMPCRRLPLLV